MNKGSGSLQSHPYRVSHSAKALGRNQSVMKDYTEYETVHMSCPVHRIWSGEKGLVVSGKKKHTGVTADGHRISL